MAVHHLHLCDVDIGWFDTQCRLVPPLRGTRDREALRAGLVRLVPYNSILDAGP